MLTYSSFIPTLDLSLKSNSSFRDGVSRKTRKPARNTESRPSSFFLTNSGILALRTSGQSDTSSGLSADVHSIISAMLDPEIQSSESWSRRLTGLSSLSDHSPSIAEEAPPTACSGQMSSATRDPGGIAPKGKPQGMLKKWVDWQRVAEQELIKSRMTWEDTKQSIQDVAGMLTVLPLSLNESTDKASASLGRLQTSNHSKGSQGAFAQLARPQSAA